MDGQTNLDTDEVSGEDTSVLTTRDIEYHLKARLKKKGCDIKSDDDKINRRRLNDILEDFRVPNSTDIHCRLNEMPTFREVVNYILSSYESETDEIAAEQDAVLPEQTRAYEPATA